MKPAAKTLPIIQAQAQTAEQNDAVNHPSHYTNGSVECIDAIQAALTEQEFQGYCKGNAMKYIWREGHKGGVEDLQKATWYMDRLVHGS